jgi:hypothetical protein
MWVMGINNAAGHPRIRPNAFVCSDPPKKFSHSIWLDPGVMKLIPSPKLSKGSRGNLRKKVNGVFSRLDVRTQQCPNVWGFRRESWMWPDDRFFLGPGACWGNLKKGVEKTKLDKTVSTLFLGIRLMRYLGCPRLYLLGVDLRMTPERGYSFAQARDEDAQASNNNAYKVINRWMCEMASAGVFTKFGMEVYNCYERSGLRAFPYVPFEEAVIDCRGIVERAPDLSGWYEK